MEQLFFPTSDFLMVDTNATNLHKAKVPINIGMELAARNFKADMCHWKDTIDIGKYSTIGFSVVWPMFALNIYPFLKRHKIESLKERRDKDAPAILIGGQGAMGIPGTLSEIANYVYPGEIGDPLTFKNGFFREPELISPPVIKNGKAIIEITRGCKYRCKFCVYAHRLGGPYREKSIGLVREQIDYCLSKDIDNILFRTINLPGYKWFDELRELAIKNHIYQGWGDITVKEADKIIPYLAKMRITQAKMGVESFDENTRKEIDKYFSDDCLDHVIEETLLQCHMIHLYLIYGLPGDNYDNWIKWVYRLDKIRKTIPHPVRIVFSITNFMPTPGTPMENCPDINYEDREEFQRRWVGACRDAGFYSKEWDVKTGNDFGHFGRSELPHKVIMHLWRGHSNITDAILAVKAGVGRYIRRPQAEAFLKAIEGDLR